MISSELGTGRSEIRNRVLAPIFKDLKLIEAWGSGIQKMRQELKDYPEIDLVLRESGHAFQVQFVKIAREKTEPQPESTQRRDQVGTNLELTLEQHNLLDKCKKSLPMAELMELAGRSNRTKFRKSIINPLLSAGFIERTEPDSPKSPKQKYRTTEKGEELIKKQE